MIDWDKPIETVGGYPARVISTDYEYHKGILTVMQIKYVGFSGIAFYHQNGEPAFGSPDIRNRKPKLGNAMKAGAALTGGKDE